MLVVEIDMVGAKPLEATLDHAPDLLRSAVGVAAMSAGGLVDVPAEFGGDDDLLAEAGEGLADHVLIGPRAIDLRGVEEVHAVIDRRSQERDHLRAIGNVSRFAVTHGAK